MLMVWSLNISSANALYEKESAGGFVVVGPLVSGSVCDFGRIQDAIASGASEIRITSGVYATGNEIVLDDTSIKLWGGYATCEDAQNPGFQADEVATIVGGGLGPVITILGNSQRNSVELRNLIITNGTGTPLTTAGGIAAFNTDLSLRLTNIELIDNEGILGGGMSIVGGDTQVIARNLLIRDNVAPDGGGLYCAGNSVFIQISDGSNPSMKSGILDNFASNGDGGGIYMETGCTIDLYSGTSNSSASIDRRGIYRNKAQGSPARGGGVYMQSGSHLILNGEEVCEESCLGNNEQPLNVNDNDALVGGGIFATGSTTVVDAFSVLLERNDAENGGAGINMTNGATFNVDSLIPSCWSPGSCNQIISNRADDGPGGAINVNLGGEVNINRALIAFNQANEGTVANIFANTFAGPRGSISIDNSVIVKNGGQVLGFLDLSAFKTNGSSIRLNFSTIADNGVTEQVFLSIGNSIDNSSNINLTGNIIRENAVIYEEQGSFASLTGDCVLANNDNTLLGEILTNVFEGNPVFLDPVNNDYHIDASLSEALDLCESDGSVAKDLDGEIRGFDDPNTVNVLGPYDAGADETYENDVIFVDGFEG